MKIKIRHQALRCKYFVRVYSLLEFCILAIKSNISVVFLRLHSYCNKLSCLSYPFLLGPDCFWYESPIYSKPGPNASQITTN